MTEMTGGGDMESDRGRKRMRCLSQWRTRTDDEEMKQKKIC